MTPPITLILPVLTLPYPILTSIDHLTAANTTRDLIELEKLHDARVKRLESQLSLAKKRAAEAIDQVDVLNRQVTHLPPSLPPSFPRYTLTYPTLLLTIPGYSPQP